MAIMASSHSKDQARQWLSWQSTRLSAGLSSEDDAERLFSYWKTTKGLPEFADTDEWVDEDSGIRIDLAKHRMRALGYDPLQNGNF